MCIRFSLTLYLSGKIAFSRQQRLIYFQYPLHRFFDQSHTSVSPLSSGGFNTSPIRLRFFLSSVFAAQSAAPSPILSDNQNQRNILCKIRAASAVEDNGFVFCSLCRRDVEINGLPYSLFPASLLIYVKNPFPACEDRSCFRSCREWRGLHFRRTFQQAVRTTE